ncbi:G protein-coupled receptor-related domain containing protein [Babesia gibsoni]|uniref:G protein-coupled receptor-related domain containing protein n=1 Tax=Babesia gibsoni TaxID=33632 RepID=A0AAD8PEY6_BABGI|nr:G protein-coupled receptor-related domain containing protein [Babesia gibsoni]
MYALPYVAAGSTRVKPEVPVKIPDGHVSSAQFPEKVSRLNRRFPDTLLVQLMKEYCYKKHGPMWFLACDDGLDTCKCYDPMELSLDTLLVSQKDQEKLGYARIGAPYGKRSNKYAYNLLSSRLYNLCPFDSNATINITSPLDVKTKNGTAYLIPTAAYNIPKTDIDKLIDDYKKATLRVDKTKKVSDVFDIYRTRPHSYLNSNIYQRLSWKPNIKYETDQDYSKLVADIAKKKSTTLNMRKSIYNKNEDISVHVSSPRRLKNTNATASYEYCNLCRLFSVRHGINICDVQCNYLDEYGECERNLNGRLCKPLVSTRFYREVKKPFYIPMDFFTFSSTVSAYLTPQGETCGTETSFKNGLRVDTDMLTKGVTVFDEMVYGNRRVFKLGPFQHDTVGKKFNICVCATNDSKEGVGTCMHHSHYARKFGEVIMVDSDTKATEGLTDGTVTVTAPESTIIVLHDAKQAGTCYDLFDLVDYDWPNSEIRRLHSNARNMSVIIPSDKGEAMITFRSAGLYRICIVNDVTLEVKQHENIIRVAGVRKNVKAAIYHNASGELVASSFVFEWTDDEVPKVDGFYIVDSQSNCSAKEVGRWHGQIHPFLNNSITNNKTLWVARGAKLTIDEKNMAKSYLICVKHSDKVKTYPVGVARVQYYIDSLDKYLKGTPFYTKRRPSDVHNLVVSRSSGALINFTSRVGTEYNNRYEQRNNYYFSMIEESEQLILQFRCYMDLNLVTVWLMTEKDPQFYPLFTFKVNQPKFIRAAEIEGKLNIYVFDRKSKLHQYDLNSIPSSYTPLTHTKTVDYHGEITSVDIVGYQGTAYLVGVDMGTSCITVWDKAIAVIQPTNRSTAINFAGAGSVSCVRGTQADTLLCFLTMPLKDEIWLVEINTKNKTITHKSTYHSGREVDDLDPEMGTPKHINAVLYTHEGKTHAAVAFFRENGTDGGLLHADLTNWTMKFVSPLQFSRSNWRIHSIYSGFDSVYNKSMIVLAEDYTSNVLQGSLDVESDFNDLRWNEERKWRMSWVSFEGLLRFPALKYNMESWLPMGYTHYFPSLSEKYKGRLPQRITYSLVPFYDVEKDILNKVVTIDEEGNLTMKSDKLLVMRFEVVQHLLFIQWKRRFEIHFLCPDGMFHDGNKCDLCPINTYNGIKYAKNDSKLIFQCTPCPTNRLTLGLGAPSLESCYCKEGYSSSSGKSGEDDTCQPCEPGTYKSTVGPEECTRLCSLNSFSNMKGSTSVISLFCKCYAGYYLSGQECRPCEEGYFCIGGYKSKQQKCPPNTTTLKLASKSLSDCACIAGYEPADEARIRTEGTYESQLFKEIGERYGSNNHHSLVCVPCAYNEYKDSVGKSSCVMCPLKTYSTQSGNTSKEQCNRCSPGYYETNDPANPCEMCPPNSICVGSDPVDPNLKSYSGKRMKCHKNSITMPPYDSNIFLNDCLCEKGHSIHRSTGMIKCEPVPKNTYKDLIGNVGATECPHGSYTLNAGAKSALECVCGKGTYFDTERMKCTTCPAGKYCLGGRLPNGEHAPPMVCDDTYALTTTEGASGPGDCVCKPGYYPASGSMGACVQCPANTYKAFASNDECTPCDENSSTGGKIGATSKRSCLCSPGYYYDRGCRACGYKDKYCPGGLAIRETNAEGEEVYEPREPESCPANMEIPPGVDTADSIESCNCAKGYAFVKRDEVTNQKICAPCAPGSFKSSVMDSSCNGLCTQNATSLPGAKNPTQCFCQEGYYYLAGGICAPCVEGAKCDGGLINMDERKLSKMDVVVSHTEHVKPVPIEGYYLDKINTELRKPDDWGFIKCPIKGACLGEEGCSESMTEYLCAECKMGYTNNFNKGALCTQCPNTLKNVLLLVAWYLGLLLVNIVMACLNVSAGFNRRSIHSIVIKIALNYGICMSVLNVVNFSDFALPEEIKSVSLRWFKMMYREKDVYHMSLDCLMQKWFGMNHANSFFYTMLFVAFLPVILLVVVTVLMWIILELFKIKRHSVTRSKLALLHQSRMQGMTYLSERLRDEYANERLFLIFRYIPLPGETHWVRFKHFLEDMIPIYVTVLFSVHGNTTSQMLSLLDCTFITLGQSVHSKYVLRPAMSIKCSLDPKMGYIPYFLLGMGGLIFWGFGIPFFSFLVLLLNRKKLYAPDVRMKYGFLHNGYQQDYWFWEAVVFIRKCLVLVIGSIVIVPSHNLSGSRIWMALAVALVFLVIQLIYKPFDERDYMVLGRLESHSMIAWTASLLTVSLMCYLKLTPLVITVACGALLINSGYFFYVVTKSFVNALQDAVKHRSHKSPFKSRNWIKRMLLYFESTRKSNEPLITYSQEESHLKLKLQRKRRNIIGLKSSALKSLESYYFTNIVTELYRIVVCRLKLDVMPRLVIEFLLRLSISITKFEEKMAKKELFKDLADGDLSRLVAWATENESRKLHKIVKLYHEDGDSGLPNVLLNDKSLNAAVGLSRDELQYIMDCLFDDKVLMGKTNLSDFYQSLTRIWIMDTDMLTFLFSVFKHVKIHYDKECADVMKKSNSKLQTDLNSLQTVIDHIESSGKELSVDDIKEMEERLKKLLDEQDRLRKTLQQMQEDPDNFDPTSNEGEEKSDVDIMLQGFGFNVKGAMEKYVADFNSDSEEETTSEEDSESESESDSEYESGSESESEYESGSESESESGSEYTSSEGSE